MNHTAIVSILRTPLAVLIVLVSALAAQIPHASDVFRLVVGGDSPLAYAHGFVFALALEMAVLMFVVQQRQFESYGFAAVSVCMNLSYYHLHGVPLLSPSALPAWLVSVALPVAIAQYSHLLADATHTAAPPAPAQQAHDARAERTARGASGAHVDAQVRGLLDALDGDATGAPDATGDARAEALRRLADGATAKQVADAMQISVNTVRSWRARSRK